ncbi:hypothetical protein Tco_1330674, partial [Tanacetum coccineum]
VIASLAVLLIGLGGLESSEFVHDPQHACSQYQLPLSAILRSPSRQSSSLVVTSSGLSYDVSDAGLPSKMVMASGKNGDDSDLLLFRDGPGAGDISAGTLRLPERLVSQVFLEWNVQWRLPVPGSCQSKTNRDVNPDRYIHNIRAPSTNLIDQGIDGS